MTADPEPSAALTCEAAESAAAARRQIARNAAAVAALGASLRAAPPAVVVTCARGSSDHAAHYGKYLIETELGVPVASIGPSVASLYGTSLKLSGALVVAVSQSGRSPDLIRLVEAACLGGARVVGFVNDETSPLAALCDLLLPLAAGPETSVAATKSYLLSCLAFLTLVAAWSQAPRLAAAVEALPDALDAARALDWGPALATLVPARGLFVLGRGVGLGAALEMALKFKETCGLHAEAFSSAEVSHGPLDLVGPDFPVFALGQDDASGASTRATVARIVGLGAPVWSVFAAPGARILPTLPSVAPVLAPLCEVQSFYMALARLARARGHDPDHPAHLRKVTQTL